GKNTNAIDSEFDGYGRIEIAGDVENAAEIYQKDIIVTSGKLTNDAETKIYAEYLTNNTEIVNNGIINPSNVTNEANASIENTGEINATNIINKENTIINNKENGNLSTNYLDNNGTINNESDFNVTSLFESSGTVTNSGTITAGDLTNYANGIINNEENGKINATSKLDNKGIINNESGAEIKASELTNSGTITSSGTIDALTMINDGTINNEENGEIVADSAFINNGTVVNKSSITARNNLTNNENGNITNSENAEINATRLINSGTITNEGTIKSENAIENSGTITSHAENIITNEIKNNNGKYIVTGGTVSYKITGDQGEIDIKDNEVTIANDIENNTINLETTLKLEKESYLKDSSTLSIGGTNSVLDIENGEIGTVDAAVAITAATWELKLDIDLQNATADMLSNVADNNGTVMISALNILTDKANNGKIKIADNNIVNVYDVIYHFSTETMNYKAVLTGDASGSYLQLTADGYGGLANAIYDGDLTYSVVQVDTVTAWIDGKNYLTNDLEISGDNHILKSTTNVEGIVVSDDTQLKINDLAEMSGFNNALTVN
ncbi:MAG: hypothetical protein II090_03510, partial [Elusimicrobia bacterium]|nr:hypothetical protein [Elusimicrobiota bacterium]